MIDGVIGFLSGDTRTIQAELTERMREAAAEERFEEAARYRNRLFSIRHLADRQAADRRAVGSVDVIGLAIGGDQAAVQVFPLRDGKMIDRYGFHLENVAGEDAQSILEAFVLEYYGAAPSAPPEVLVSAEIDTSRARGVPQRPPWVARRRPDAAARREAAARRAGRGECAARARVRLRDPGSHALETDRRARGAPRGAQPREPARADRCFDVSNIQGESIVASMTVFVDGRSKNAHYRTFSIRSLEGQDDVGAMREAVARRFARLKTGDLDESFSRMPNLVVVDGGKGQLAAASRAMEELDLPRVAVIALAKREEEVFVPGFPVPIVLDRSSPALQLLQRIRDEAHRVALRYHRRKRSARSMETIFEGPPG